MSNICAGIGRGQMEVLDSHIALEEKCTIFYVDVFKDIEGVTVFCPMIRSFQIIEVLF
jgi:dTDP-4-amino-4,6-dideoxygalactose transaminase